MNRLVIIGWIFALVACGGSTGGTDLPSADAQEETAGLDVPVGPDDPGPAPGDSSGPESFVDIPHIPVECPNLPSSFDAAITVNGAGEEKLSDCVTKPDCFETMVCSHRGVHDRDHPENSIPGILKAIELGVDFVEIDIRETKDDILVLMHDSTLDRTTDGTGNVSERTLEQLQDLRLKEPETKEIFEDATIPTLEEVFAVTRGKVILDLDLKTSRMDLVAAFIQKHDGYEYMIARKGGTAALTELRKLDEQIVIMADFYELEDLDSLIEAIDPGLVQVDYDFGKEVIDMLHEKGIKAWDNALGPIDVFLAASCSSIPLQSYLDKGIDIVQTDYPHFVCPLLKGYSIE